MTATRRPTDRAARTLVLGALSRLDSGTVVVREPGRPERRYGPGRPDRFGRPSFEVTAQVRDPRLWRSLVTGGSAGLGQAFADHWWEVDDLTGFLRLLSRAVRRYDPVRTRLTRAADAAVARLRHRQDPDRDRSNISAHYDLGNDFFASFLDPTMTYSSGVFAHPDADLADASTEKLDRLCRLLELEPGDEVAEIGTGWGSFATHAAGRYGARVTTTTISAEQYEWARKRVAAEGLADRVEVRNDDYRDLRGTFQKLASIEMIEAVDWRELDTFFATCTGLLAPDGLMGLQAIVVPGNRWASSRDSHDFIKTHIFPGGCLPSIDSISRSISRVSDLTLVELHDYGLHYAETLRGWRANLAEHRHQLDPLGLDDRFVRLWEFYLAYCEAGFEEREISVVQCLLARPGWRPPTPFPA